MQTIWGALPPRAACALLAAVWLFPAAPARARDEEAITVNAEIEAYVETGRTNFAGDYNVGAKGNKFWDQFFGDGLEADYSYTETWHRETELRFSKRTRLSESWRMDNQIEFEFKGRNASTNNTDFDVEEASAIFSHSSGFFLALGILEDLRLQRGGWATTTGWMGGSASDEEPSVRAGYRKDEWLADVRYHSIVKETTTGDPARTKQVNEQLVRLQLAYVVPERLSAVALYTVVDTENKEAADFQAARDALNPAEFRDFQAAGLTDYVNWGLGLGWESDPFSLWATHEDWRYDLDDGASSYDVVIDAVGLGVRALGPADLVVVYETGTGDPTGPEVTYWAWSAEYLWSPSAHYRIGDPQIGPGLKLYGNDADEPLEGQAYYVVMEWRF